LSKPIDTIKLNTILEKWLPKEKITKAATKDDPFSLSNECNKESLIQIEGVDVNKGIAISGGTPTFYLDTLAVFYEDGLERINAMKECLETGNLSLYTTYVHAVKSASLNIGADTLFENATELELAGDRKDLVYIETHNAKFLADLESLLEKIKRCLSAQSKIKREMKAFLDPEIFKSELIKLKMALNKMDGSAINEAVDHLKKSAPSNDAAAAIRSISNNILLAEYDEAKALIDSLLREVI